MKIILTTFMLICMSVAFGMQYSVSAGQTDVRVIELDEHKFVVASLLGRMGGSCTAGSGAGVSIMHSPSCWCNTNRVNIICSSISTNSVSTNVVINITK